MTPLDSVLRSARFAGLIMVAVALPPLVQALPILCTTPYTIGTFVGTPGGEGSQDGQGSEARFRHPASTAADLEGNIYVADYTNHTIRKISSTGLVTTFAGSRGSRGAVDGLGSDARFSNPSGVAVDRSGNVYVSDSGNCRIRKITAAGVVTTLAGSAPGFADGPSLTAQFYYPRGLAVDQVGNVYVADTENSTIRKISPEGTVTTFAGLARNSGTTDGPGSAARFSKPYGVAVDEADMVYVVDTGNFTIRKITPTRVVSTLAGIPLSSGTTDGPGANAQFGTAYGIAADAAGTVYVADSLNNRIRKITAVGVVTTLAGGIDQNVTRGWSDGVGSSARFENPNGVAVDAVGNLYVADQFNHTIRKITANGFVTTVAGSARRLGSTDGIGADATLRSPCGIAVDKAGNFYVADYFDGKIRKISPNAVVSTLVDSTADYRPLGVPFGLVVDSAGNVYVSDNNLIRKVTPAGSVSVLAGTPSIYGGGDTGPADGTGTLAQFNDPRGLAIDGADNIYVADAGNSTIRKITPAGVVTTLAGRARVTGFRDGIATESSFAHPEGVAVDDAGDVYVADTGNGTVRKISGGIVTTLAGNPSTFGSQSGTGSGANFREPWAIAIGPTGDLYIAEGNAISQLTQAGVATMIAGNPANESGAYDGTGFVARLYSPSGMVVTAAGDLYIADTNNGIIRKAVPPSVKAETVRVGYPVTLVPKASGLSGTSYRWQKNGSDLPGALNFSLAVPSADFVDAGVYRMVAFNSFATSVSEAIDLAVLPAIPANGRAAEFNGDGQADLVWSNGITGEVAVWLMNGAGFLKSVTLGNFLPEWTVAATGDFNGDGKTDIVWSDSVTGERALWLMNGTNLLGIASLGIFPLEWTVAATGDFNADGKPDLVWSNSLTGERALWLMNGTNLLGVSTLGTFPLEWTVAATGDFNADGKPDIVWSNSITGERALWLMDGTTRIGVSTLGIFPLEWTVAGTADFNADSKPDIIWSNSITGERALWLMNGTQFLGASTLGIFPLEWTVKN